MKTTIHYIWLGGKPLSNSAKYCIESWRHFCPSCEIKQWNESNFPIEQFTWVRQAIECGKYAFASDFIRLYVLQKYGGIYMDTDVELLRDVLPLIKESFVTGFLNHHFGTDYMKNVSDDGYLINSHEKVQGFGINTGFLYSKPNHPVLDKVISNVYGGGNLNFINADGTINPMIIDGVIMNVLHDYFGVKFKDETQNASDGILVYNSQIIATQKTCCEKSFLIHWFDGSWKEPPRKLKEKIKQKFKRKFPMLYRKVFSSTRNS